MNFNNNIIGTDPIGLWKLGQIIGAKAKIVSLSVRSGLFGYPSEEYTIEDINFYIDTTGRLKTAIKLEGLDRTFGWKDLEVTEIKNYGIWQKAICGEFCCGSAICGYETY